jgi:hypothetical protein
MKIDRMRMIALKDLANVGKTVAPRSWWKYAAERKRTTRKRTSIRQAR